jgi:hypothetical protein
MEEISIILRKCVVDKFRVTGGVDAILFALRWVRIKHEQFHVIITVHLH